MTDRPLALKLDTRGKADNRHAEHADSQPLNDLTGEVSGESRC